MPPYKKKKGVRVAQRSSARLSQHSQSESTKRTSDSEQQQPQHTINGHKRRKTNSSNQQERLAHVLANMNMAVGELFSLTEYKSIVYWNPQDYASNLPRAQVPELFQDFSNSSKYKVVWDETIEDDEEVKNLPLRFQKKILAERDKKLLEKFPYRDEVIERSHVIESELLNSLEPVKEEVRPKSKQTPVHVVKHEEVVKPAEPKKRGPGRPPKKKIEEEKIVEVEEEEEEEEEEEISEEEEQSSKYNIKSIKYTLAPPLVTHPSHIPKWRPTTEQMIDSNQKHEIIEFNPTPLKITQTKKETIEAPEVAEKLRGFLDTNYKTPIIDESNMPDFNNTAQEYDSILTQQSQLFSKISFKINQENSLELNGDKIERRKVVLPQTSNIKLTDPFRTTGSVIPKLQGLQNNLTHHDYLLNQGISFAKVHNQMRRQHQLRTRKIASMIEQHFKKKKGEKERLAREREQNLKKISRLAIQAVKKRWNQAYKVYQFIQQEKEEEIKQKKGREHLSQMLEHSTQLLEAQLASSSREATADIESESLLSDEVNEDSDSDRFSSSSSEEEEDREQVNGSAKDTDMNLSIEELKKKYANMEDSVEPSSTAEREESQVESQVESEAESQADSEESGLELESDSQDDTDVSRGLASLYGVNEVDSPAPAATPLTEYTEQEKELIDKFSKEEETIENSILDSDEASSISDWESDESGGEADEELEEQVSDQEETEETTEKSNGLASLFNNLEEESGEDEDVEMDEGSGSDDYMSTTEDEQEEPQEEEEQKENGTSKSTEDTEVTEEVKVEEINGSMVRDVPLPSLLRGVLRPYQKQGLNWLASLYNNNTNGILADEMGLGKTIQTIALISYLACEHHIWGPHLIIVPTSVMLNWEMEFKKFAPGFKVLTYYGSPQQRAQKRKGWNKPDAFHVCITSYQLVVQDQQSFKRRRWRYMILDEAHNIKNFRSTRWRALLNFNTENRLLLTGTPLQNNLMELWSLLYFLMPSSKVNQAMPEGFANLEDFQQWFGRPVDKIMEQTTLATGGNTADLIDENNTVSKLDEETRNTVARLHQVLRPYLLRRLKKDVEKQMPGKYEHIVYCRLSKRQRFLYDDFMSRAKTKETLASGNFLSIINCLMQLRKVCNHPDLFEVRPIVTSFVMPRSVSSYYQPMEQLVNKQLNKSNPESINFSVLNLDITSKDSLNYFVCQSSDTLQSSTGLQEQITKLSLLQEDGMDVDTVDVSDYLKYYQHLKAQSQREVQEKLKQVLYLNSLRCGRKPLYGKSLLDFLTLKPDTDSLDPRFVLTIPQRVEHMSDTIEKFSIITPTVIALDMKDQIIPISTQRKVMHQVFKRKITNPFHKSQVKLSIAFPDKSLLQYDCGKLQKLASLLQTLTSQGHRALIFTQMTKVLDILEQFLNIHGYRYMRLDGATKIEDRQLLTEKFNRDAKIPVFILSSRSGGLGINLTGADTVIFYDSDWNPAMDKQCQDRCHRIGQVRDVHIYRFVSEYTIESNILKKANQKRQLDNVVIQEGEFTTDYFGKFSVRDLVNDNIVNTDDVVDRTIDFSGDAKMGNVFAQAEDEEDRVAAGAALKEVAVDDEDFKEESKSVTATGTPVPDSSVPAVPAAMNGGLMGIDDLADQDFEEGIGHIDEYMLRFISDGYY
ncbi:Helicase SWR1 [Spathaspora sp. JA1]|nr:Helicase SWR1 [Spathaspora sp. JA1]